MRCCRLSKRVKWILMPQMYESGTLYFRLTVPGGQRLYASVRGGKRVQYWLNHILHRTIADEVERIPA